MSKENLSSKSSINVPEEGVKNAAEDNKLESSINTPERVEPLEAAQTKASEPPQERQSQNKPVGKRTLKEDTALYGARVARAGIAASGVAIEVVKEGSKVIASPAHIVEGVINVGEKVAKAYDPVDKLQQGAKIKEKGPPNPGIADKVLDKINQINSLKTSIGNYEDKKDLLEKERQAKIDTKALEEFLATTPKIDQLSQGQLKEHFNVTRAKVAERPEFAPPAGKTNFEKAKSAVKAGVGYFVESQFGDLKEIYGKKEEQKSSNVLITPNIQKPKTPKIAKAEEKVHHMQESLTHGKVTSRSNNISPLPTQEEVHLRNKNLQEEFSC